MYGTAWKEDATERLVAAALEAGFRSVDTANQRKHYHEEGVGRAVKAALASGRLQRQELFLQTKFTFKDGQDHRLPYDPKAPIAKQVEQSLASSLEHLGVDYVDSLVLHGPSRYGGLGPADHEAWGAMEDAAKAGRVRVLGLSNVSAPQLEEFWTRASVKPVWVQNRTFTRPQADHAVREFAGSKGMAYQGFSLLTAQPQALRSPAVARAAEAHGKTPAQIVFRYCMQANIVPLTGTTSKAHMADDLAVEQFRLDQAEFAAIGKLYA